MATRRSVLGNAGAVVGGAPAAVGGAIAPAPMDLSFLTDPANPYNQPAPDPYAAAPDPGMYAAAPAPPAPSLAADPGWIALQAELDKELAMSTAEAERRQGQIVGTRDRLLADLIPRGEAERTTISGGMEARGLFGGGQMEETMARQRANEGRRQSGIQTDAYTGISDLQAAQAAQAQAIETKRAQARADYMSRGYVA